MAKSPTLPLWRLTARPARSRAKVPPSPATIYIRAATRGDAIDLISGGVVITRAVKVSK